MAAMAMAMVCFNRAAGHGIALLFYHYSLPFVTTLSVPICSRIMPSIALCFRPRLLLASHSVASKPLCIMYIAQHRYGYNIELMSTLAAVLAISMNLCEAKC